eukprot:11634022-Alexandrium_andersonii.AAC.1
MRRRLLRADMQKRPHAAISPAVCGCPTMPNYTQSSRDVTSGRLRLEGLLPGKAEELHVWCSRPSKSSCMPHALYSWPLSIDTVASLDACMRM